MTKLRAGAATDVGRVRTNNQDQLLVTAELFAVADGMGGHAAGEVASLTAVEALEAAYKNNGGADGLVAAAQQANRSIWDRARSDPDLHGMGTTLVAVALVNEDGEERLAVVNVGDSRVYLLRQGELEQLTTDHSLVQELVDDGQLTEQEASVHPQRHVLTRALGVDSEVSVDLLEVLPLKGDRLMLCSDGLVRELTDDQVASVMRRFVDPKDAARELVAAAKDRGGNDNITVVIVDVVEDEDLPAAASAALQTQPSLHRATPMPAAEATRSQPAERGGGGAATTLSSRVERPIAASVPEPPKRSAFTWRVVGFLAIFLVLIAGAGLVVAWYARGSYFVGLDGAQLTIYKGRPGGLLWFQPTVAKMTGATTSQVLPSRLPDLRSGKEEPSLGAAQTYVSTLLAEATREQATTTTTTTVPVTTTTLAPTSPPTA
ncbi:MAG TPA: Stp1/IreP family PP2C-type Ser/Thr phosphatase [Acidimicrobiales bacterium]|jgi:protein phosphatase|nr:Stp1/IreP family PP2C-type Ser/Thr phosphatase [Acidimicrobiales bacterium]